jgi:hypothetical protein
VANAETLTGLQNRALDYADMTGSAFPVTARLTDYINAGYTELYEMLVGSYGADYVRTATTQALTAGTEAYALPSDFYKMLRVWEVVGSTRYAVERFVPSQLDGYKTTGPGSAGSLSLWYAPQLTLLSAGADIVHVSVCTGWEDFIALHAAIRLKMREDSDPSALMAERETLRRRIVENAEPRDQGVADEIEDHYNRWGSGNSNASSLRYRVMGNQLIVVDMGEVV